MSPTERYVISEPLANGGMGDVYRGRRIGPAGFSKDVVLKQLRQEFARDPRISELFLQEARLTAGLDHPNIVATLDLIRSPDGLCIVMEYVRGADLRVLLRKARRRGQRLSVASGLYLGVELLAALDYLHNQTDARGAPLGLLHRDVSPANVLISATGAVKLTDFGIAGLIRLRGDLAGVDGDGAQQPSGRWRSLSGAGRDLPKTTGQIEDPSGIGRNPLRVRGKIGYMSPEQARGEEIDARSDLFSAAVVLYEVLVGERLFIGGGDGAQQSPAQVYSAPVPALSRRRAEIPVELDRVLGKALALNPEARFPAAAALREALREVAWRHKLALGAPELCADLREVCGPDPQEWRREDERTGTASIGAADLDDSEDPFEDPDSSRRSLPRIAQTGGVIKSGDSSDTFSRPLATAESVSHPEARSAAVLDREARSAAVLDREARSAAVLDREARSAAVLDREARSAAVLEGDATVPIERLSLHQGEPTPPQLLSALASPNNDTAAERRGPIRLTLTERLPREAGDALGIAAMARQMVPDSARDKRQDETAALTTLRAAPATRPVPIPSSTGGAQPAVPLVKRDASAGPAGVVTSDAVEQVPHSIALSRKNLLLIFAVVLFLLGIGVTVGMVLSGPGGAHSQNRRERPSARSATACVLCAV